MDWDAIAKWFFEWLEGFGHGVGGFLVLLMVCATICVVFCLPRMYKMRLDHKKSMKETDLEVKRLDLEITKKVEGLAERGLARVSRKEDDT